MNKNQLKGVFRTILKKCVEIECFMGFGGFNSNQDRFAF